MSSFERIEPHENVGIITVDNNPDMCTVCGDIKLCGNLLDESDHLSPALLGDTPRWIYQNGQVERNGTTGFWAVKGMYC